MPKSFIAVAGATGQLGKFIALELRKLDKPTKALVRPGTASSRTEQLRKAGVVVVEVAFTDTAGLTEHLKDVTTVVSSLQGLRDVIVNAQTVLLEASLVAGVKRFIPSDYSLDFTKCVPGSNRNLDYRREFHEKLDASGIAWTSVLNGVFLESSILWTNTLNGEFTNLVDGTMPFMNNRSRRIIYFGNPTQKVDFTTVSDTGRYTARVAADQRPTPKFLRIAGDTMDANERATAASHVYGQKYTPMWSGPIWGLELLIWILKLFGGENDVFPAWQGMQYCANLFSGHGKLEPLDNDRYPDMKWTTIQESLAKYESKKSR